MCLIVKDCVATVAMHMPCKLMSLQLWSTLGLTFTVQHFILGIVLRQCLCLLRMCFGHTLNDSYLIGLCSDRPVLQPTCSILYIPTCTVLCV